MDLGGVLDAGVGDTEGVAHVNGDDLLTSATFNVLLLLLWKYFVTLIFYSHFTTSRYHSLVIEKESFHCEALEVTAWTKDGLIMAARHKKYKHMQGVEFHPESIITQKSNLHHGQ